MFSGLRTMELCFCKEWNNIAQKMTGRLTNEGYGENDELEDFEN